MNILNKLGIITFIVQQAKCLPVYCQYKFHNMPIYRTKCHDHNANIYFKDVNVIFTGLLSPGKLFEFLKGPSMKKKKKRKNPPVQQLYLGLTPVMLKKIYGLLVMH